MQYNNTPNNMYVKTVSDSKDNNYLSLKATLNRCVFKTDLKFSKDNAFLISAGNLFHNVGTATLNAQSPYYLSRDTGTCNSI